MTILLTNDDGLDAPGLEVLERILGADHDLWVVAPDREKSGASHGITLLEGIKVLQHGDKRFSVRGTPADCINIALQAVLPISPDFVISGINKGPNLGTDIVYSGTCAAAREASLHNVPSMAASLATLTGPWDYRPAARFISENLRNLFSLWTENGFINLNIPPILNPGCVPKMTRPGRRRYLDEMVCFRSPRDGDYWFFQPASIESSDEEGTDTRSAMDGEISLSLVNAEPTLAPIAPIHDTMDWRGT